MAKIKLKNFESFLQDIDGFEKPKVLLEQYETPSHIASRILYTAESSFGDLTGKRVADLGCGCGMLSIGAAILDASYIVGFELDSDALDICLTNIEEFEISTIDLVQIDVNSLTDSRWSNQFDTVILNPPFGTKRDQGIDMKFLRAAIDLSTHRVYSLHKSSTRDYIKKKAKEWNTKFEVLATLRYNIDNSYKFHKKKSVDIDVDLIQLTLK